ncbi:MAG: CHRD domain-containing protein [Verrucomicrobiae bacterium]|nr:CHRD domain-containing protein [Verrucomicrobiae bacterium]
MNRSFIAMLGAASLCVLGQSAQGARHTFATSLTALAEGVVSPGTGSAVVKYDGDVRTLTVSIVFADLVAGTTVAHIHAPTAEPNTGNVGVATYPVTFPGFPVGLTEGAYNGTWDLSDPASYTAAFYGNHGSTPETAEAGLLAAMFAGKAYVNIHTTTFPGGEIRGYLASVPDHSPMVLLFAPALAAVVGVRRWMQR